MKSLFSFSSAAVKRSFIATAVAASFATSAFAVTFPPAFTFHPELVGLTGTATTGDKIAVTDFATVTFTGGNGFTEAGYFALSGLTFHNSPVGNLGGLNNTYSLYIQFSGTGTLTAPPNPLTLKTIPTDGTFNTLTYTLYGVDGAVTYDASATGTTATSTSTSAPVQLATGTLQPGSNSVSTSPANSYSQFTASANAGLTFNPDPTKVAFFSPNPFYNLAFSAFTNNAETTGTFFDPVTGKGGFFINGGGGDISFANAVPEPGSVALIGLGLLGLVLRKRKEM